MKEPSTYEQFKADLRSDLVKQAQTTDTVHRPSVRPVRVLVAAAVFVVAGLGALSVTSPNEVAADAFEISEIGQRVVVEIVDSIEDPEAAEAELLQKAGLVAEFEAVPTGPELVGSVVSWGGTGTVDFESVFDDAGALREIILPSRFNGQLFVEYGRPADGDEPYGALPGSDPLCREVWGLPPAETLPVLNQAFDTLRFELVQQDNRVVTDIDPARIPANARLSSLSRLSRDSALATYAINLTPESQHPNCRRP